MIYGGEYGRVQQNCDFVTQKGVIEPEAIRLADGVFLMTILQWRESSAMVWNKRQLEIVRHV
jgi:hypothetical protein